ncbi:MAG: hypothetical protein ACOCSR_04845 [Wenzhouxiangella sp.]
MRVVPAGASSWSGQAEGIDERGALRVRTGTRVVTVNAGEVSVRDE